MADLLRVNAAAFALVKEFSEKDFMRPIATLPASSRPSFKGLFNSEKKSILAQEMLHLGDNLAVTV
ncbi:MAG: hypothetical protein H7Z40_19700 [Phycisphaerae bacterium]|nr:hypothetical protein [Gemmatimonadaceae bacterium]